MLTLGVLLDAVLNNQKDKIMFFIQFPCVKMIPIKKSQK